MGNTVLDSTRLDSTRLDHKRTRDKANSIYIDLTNSQLKQPDF